MYLPIVDEGNKRTWAPERVYIPNSSWLSFTRDVKTLNDYVTNLIIKRREIRLLEVNQKSITTTATTSSVNANTSNITTATTKTKLELNIDPLSINTHDSSLSPYPDSVTSDHSRASQSLTWREFSPNNPNLTNKNDPFPEKLGGFSDKKDDFLNKNGGKNLKNPNNSTMRKQDVLDIRMDAIEEEEWASSETDIIQQLCAEVKTFILGNINKYMIYICKNIIKYVNLQSTNYLYITVSSISISITLFVTNYKNYNFYPVSIIIMSFISNYLFNTKQI